MIDLGVVLALGGGALAGAGVAYYYLKGLLNAGTDLLIAIRDAAEDDKITEEEFQRIVAAGEKVVSELRRVR